MSHRGQPGPVGDFLGQGAAEEWHPGEHSLGTKARLSCLSISLCGEVWDVRVSVPLSPPSGSCTDLLLTRARAAKLWSSQGLSLHQATSSWLQEALPNQGHPFGDPANAQQGLPPSWELASSVMGVGVSSGTWSPSCHGSWLVFPSKMPRDPTNTSRRAFTRS